MKSVFDLPVRDELIERISTLNDSSRPQWGKMTVYQMLKHCTLWEEMLTGKQSYKRALIGRLFGKIALKQVLNDDKPLQRNAPTIPQLKIKGTGGAIPERNKWITLIRDYEHFANADFVHPFFGKMTRDQIGHFSYKHTDHHLRQFNS